jgi:plastocyanin
MTRKLPLITLVAAVALALAGCASSAGDTGSSSSTSSTSSMSMPSASNPTSVSGQLSSSTTAGTEAAVISIKDFAFKVPSSVAPGAAITIRNGDSQAHTVTSKAGGFDVKVNPNDTATLTAPNKPGNYPFVCTFHANMTGTLVVK